MKLNKTQMHKRPTYETLVRDTILEPKDKIALPDREATILRKTQQLSRYDDAEFLDMEKDNEQIAKQQVQQQAVNAAAAAGTGSVAQTRAEQPGPHEGHAFVNPPKVPKPAQGPKRTYSARPTRVLPQTHLNAAPQGPAQSYATPEGPPQSYGPAAQASSTAASSSASAAETTTPQHLGKGVEEAVEEAKAETDEVFAEAARQAAAREETIRRQIATNLGPSSETADASYVTRLAVDARKGKGYLPKSYGRAEVEPTHRDSMGKKHHAQLGKLFRSMSAAHRNIASAKEPSPPLPPPLIDPSHPTPLLDPTQPLIPVKPHKKPWEIARASSAPALKYKAKSKARSRSIESARGATSPPPAPKMKKTPLNLLQVEAKRRRRAAKTQPTPPPPPAKSPAPKPAKPPSPPPAKAAAKSEAASSSGYPTFHAASAKVEAKTPAKKKAKTPSPPPAAVASKAAPAEELRTGEEARRGGTYIDYSTDRAYWLTKTKTYLHDQLSLRKHKSGMTASAWGRVSKPDLIAIILSLPVPAKKP